MQSVRSLGEVSNRISDRRVVDRPQNLVSARQFRSGDAEITSVLYIPHSVTGGGSPRKNDNKSEMDKNVLLASCRRSAKTIRHKTMTFCPTQMMTLTFRENVEELSEAWSRFAYFNKLMSAKYENKWQYVCVPEYQGRGAVHFHVAVPEYFGNPATFNPVRKLWKRACGKYDGGYNVAIPKDGNKKQKSPRQIGRYISKYISKGMEVYEQEKRAYKNNGKSDDWIANKFKTVDFNKKRFSSRLCPVPPPMIGWLIVGGVNIKDTLLTLMDGLSEMPTDYVWSSDCPLGMHFLST
ncbi:hypothetical protein N9Y40_02805 [Porticoccaceae bacterium]|nr:hypothetical protein [Porticoccaceae bacterium]